MASLGISDNVNWRSPGSKGHICEFDIRPIVQKSWNKLAICLRWLILGAVVYMKGTNYRAQNNVVTTAVQAVIHAFTSLERAVKNANCCFH